jgi:DNA gyrase/topoisomerase IV subunit A
MNIWDVVRVELEEIQKKYGDARRTSIASDDRGLGFIASVGDRDLAHGRSMSETFPTAAGR